MTYENILVETQDRVGIIRLNRPQALNALNRALLADLNTALHAFETDKNIGCIIITGSEKAFAAGVDIHELAQLQVSKALSDDPLLVWDIPKIRKPILAAVAGFALGGGCELAMMCDILYACETAKFGQPEIRLGLIPGAGGTQRLTRAIGKAKAMDMILTGRTLDAVEAERCGLVARVFAKETFLEDVIKIATQIANYGTVSTTAAKEAVNRAQETHLSEGTLFERRLFSALLATEDKQEGTQAFLEKRPAQFQHP